MDWLRGPFAGRSVFVTGAAGIVGSRLVRSLLEDEASVIALIRDEDPRSELIRSGDADLAIRVHGSLEDPMLLARVIGQYSVDAVFHLGAQTQVTFSHSQPFLTLEANVRGTYNLLEAVRRADRAVESIVVASSDKAYGESASLPYREDHPLAGRNIYEASKSAADLLATAYAHSFGLPIAVARCGNIYGPGDLNWDRIVPGTIRALLEGKRPIIRSDGTSLRDYLHVDDAITGYLRLGAALKEGREHGQAFNFGNGEPVAVLELVVAIAKAVGRADLSPDIRAEASNEIAAQWLDSTKARTRLDWEPIVALAEGLSQTVGWYRDVLS